MYQQWSWCRLRGPLRMWWHAHGHSWWRLGNPVLSSPKRSLALGSTKYTGSKVDADTLLYSVLKEEETEEVVAFLAKHFYHREPLTTGLCIFDVDDDLHAIYANWIHGLVQEWVCSEVSVVARDPATGLVAGIQMSTILTREQPNAFQQGFNSPKTKLKTLHTVLSVLTAAVDFFARFEKVDRILELAIVTVPDKLTGCGVGKRLIQESEKWGRHLGCQLAITQATGVRSQQILHSLGYESYYTMDYTTFEIAGNGVFDIDKMLGATSAKVMARLLKPEDEQPSSKK